LTKNAQRRLIDMSLDYEKREAVAVNAIIDKIPSELREGIVKRGFVDYQLLVDSADPLYQAQAVDGTGTKPILAAAMDKYDTIGIDGVAMPSNDLATQGNVERQALMNYLVCQEKIETELITAQIMEGVVKACRETRTAISKGETASADEVMGSCSNGYGFDLGCAIVGIIPKSLIDAKVIQPGFGILGVMSSGPHCNGFTGLRHNFLVGDFEERPWAREFYKGKYHLNDKPLGSAYPTLGEMLIEPTLLYMPLMQKVTAKYPYVQGINITGYGLHNFNRISGSNGQYLRYRITDPIPPQTIFLLYQDETGVTTTKMYTSFNMGMGFVMLVSLEHVEDIKTIAASVGMVIKQVGQIEAHDGDENITTLHKGGKEYNFRGYQS